jgi:hypothetical protein
MDWLSTLISALMGAVASGVPLYIKFRNAQFELSKQGRILDLEVAHQQSEHDKSNRINTEAEWKRILEYRDAELSTLRARDEAQDRQIKDLYDKFVESEKNKARLEAIEGVNKERMAALEDKLLKLSIALEGYKNVSQGIPAPGCPAGCPFSNKSGH